MNLRQENPRIWVFQPGLETVRKQNAWRQFGIACSCNCLKHDYPLDNHSVKFVNAYPLHREFSNEQRYRQPFELQKVNHYGIRGTINNWFSSYLLDPSQVTEVNPKQSVINKISYGVPQCSLLGPILFLIYMNDVLIPHRSYYSFSLPMIPLWSEIYRGNSEQWTGKSLWLA